MIKVLIVCNRNSYTNPYVSTLADGLIDIGCNVTCSLSEFWSNAYSYNIIHIQWPNLLATHKIQNGESIEEIFNNLKQKNIPIIATLHNLKPHYTKNANIIKTYNLVYKNADCFIHLGAASIDLLKKQICNTKAEHYIVFHHAYDQLYNMEISKLECRKKLGISKNSKCILCFGAFRDDEERKMIIDLKKKTKDSYFYIVPNFYNTEAIIQKNILHGIIALYKTIKYKIIARVCHFYTSNCLVPEEKLPLFLKAADVMLIQRLKILNSGNVPLAMLAGLPIVGPSEGNVGWILKKTGNFCFDTNHLNDLPNIIEEAFFKKDLGLSNKIFAEKNLSTENIAHQTKEIYQEMIEKFKTFHH